MLNISKDFGFPDDAQTQTFAILAKRGVGKTYTASVMAEEMAVAGLRYVVIDPVGVWWGLRSSASGKGAGFPIVVLGGEHGDAPLESTAGEVIADLVIEENVTLVLDLSLFRKGEQDRFVTDFAERLYLKNRKPIHLFVDEADAFAPQSPMPDQRRMLGAMEDLVRRGRARGVGLTLITQRAAVLNKSVLTQIEVLVAMRTVGPQDRKAIESWIEVHGEPDQQKTLLASLPSLGIGEAWVWSPGWLKCFEKVKVRKRITFDSSATPEVGRERETAKMAEIDLGALKERMAATIERTKANDPKALKAEVARLRSEIQMLKVGDKDAAFLKAREEALKEFEATGRAMAEKINTELLQVIKRAEKVSTEFQEAVRDLRGNRALQAPPAVRRPVPSSSTPPPRPRNPAPAASGDSEAVPRARRRVLDALAFLRCIGIMVPSKDMVALFSGKSPTSGGYFNDLGKLRSDGYIEYPSEGYVRITDAGLGLADTSDIPGTVGALHESVRTMVGNARWAVLKPLIDIYPDAMSKDDLAAAAGKSPTSGGYFNDLGRLRRFGLIDYPQKGEVVATSVLFPVGLPDDPA